MDIIIVVIIYLVYLFLLIFINYYVNLFSSKGEYTQDELKSVFPFFKDSWDVIQSKYSLSYFFLFLILSSVIGIIIPLLTINWFFNSSILFIVVFFTFPYIKNYFEDRMVTESDDYRDNYANIFAKHSEIVTIGFGIGLGSSLIYMWRNNIEINSIWFLINIIILTILLEITIKNALSK
jgi:hypothetical protein